MIKIINDIVHATIPYLYTSVYILLWFSRLEYTTSTNSSIWGFVDCNNWKVFDTIRFTGTQRKFISRETRVFIPILQCTNPLQSCGNTCGVCVTVCAALAAFRFNSFELLLQPSIEENEEINKNHSNESYAAIRKQDSVIKNKLSQVSANKTVNKKAIYISRKHSLNRFEPAPSKKQKFASKKAPSPESPNIPKK